MLDFVGKPSGSFSLSVSGRSAAMLAAGFLGMDEGEVDDEKIDQTVAEMANMFCGSIVSRIESDREFYLSSPQPARCGPDPDAHLLRLDGGLMAVSLMIAGIRAELARPGAVK